VVKIFERLLLAARWSVEPRPGRGCRVSVPSWP